MHIHFVTIRKLFMAVLALVHESIGEMYAFNVLHQGYLLAKLFVADIALVNSQGLVVGTILLQNFIG